MTNDEWEWVQRIAGGEGIGNYPASREALKLCVDELIAMRPVSSLDRDEEITRLLRLDRDRCQEIANLRAGVQAVIRYSELLIRLGQESPPK